LRAEPDEGEHAEVPRVALEVGLELAVARIVRGLRRERVVGVLGERLRADDVRRLEDAGVRRSGVEDPVAADALVAVVDDHVPEADLEQLLRGRDPGGTGADHAAARHGPCLSPWAGWPRDGSGR